MPSKRSIGQPAMLVYQGVFSCLSFRSLDVEVEATTPPGYGSGPWEGAWKSPYGVWVVSGFFLGRP